MKQRVLNHQLVKNDRLVSEEPLQGKVSHPLDLKILELLRVDGPMTRFELVMLTLKASSTVYDSLNRLMIKGYVFAFPRYAEHNQRGRPRIYYQAATHF